MNCNTCIHCEKLEWAKNVSCMYYWEHEHKIKDELPESLPSSFHKTIGFVFPYDYNPALLFGECKQYKEK